MKKTISLVLVLVLALGLAAEVAKADFTFGTPTNLGPTVNSWRSDDAGNISPDGLTLFSTSNRPGGSGQSDLWVSTRATIDDLWSEAVNLGTTVNSSTYDGCSSISVDGLTLYFSAYYRSGGRGGSEIWMTTRATTDDDWSTPVNLDPPVSSEKDEWSQSISADGLTFYFGSRRPGGSGDFDLWVTTRATIDDDWSTSVNLGFIVNSSAEDFAPSISADGNTLFFESGRTGGSGGQDLWMTRRSTIDGPWSEPVNLGPTVNSSSDDGAASISADGSALYFSSDRPGGYGDFDIWQAPIVPIVDLNGDGIVDCADMCIMVEHWGTDEPLCDIGPTPLGDGIVDVNDLIVLAEHLFEGIPPVELEEVNVDEDDDGSQVELEQGQILVVTLESNPTTGYGWEVAEIQESILEQMGEAEFKPSETGGQIVGAGGWEIFRFEAISAGQLTLKLVYRRPWEVGVEPINTFSIEVVVN